MTEKQVGADHPNASLYCDLMEYIKWRVEAVSKTIDLVRGRKYFLDNRLAAEFCLLQLRMCCELLAVGCVAIHTDVSSSRLNDEWNADQIMKSFARLKPIHFPQAVIEEKDADGVWVHAPRPGALTRDEFLRMYNFLGGLLHSGNFKRYRDRESKTFDFKVLIDFVGKLVNLLNTHQYLLDDEERMVRVIMNNAKDGRVWLNVLERVPWPPPPLLREAD